MTVGSFSRISYACGGVVCLIAIQFSSLRAGEEYPRADGESMTALLPALGFLPFPLLWLLTFEFCQQRPGLLQVCGVKPFGEPAVDLRQHLPGFFFLALLLPQPAQAHHCPQLQ